MQHWFTRKVPRRIAATCALAAVVAAAGCGLSQGEESHSMPAESSIQSPTLPPVQDTAEKTTLAQKIPVYWLENTKTGVYLYREYAADTRHQEPISDAVAYLLAGKAADPKWYTHLKASNDIGASIDSANLITLDLPAKVFAAHLDEGLSERTIQQLVFTATAAASNAGILVGQTPASVRILVDGQPNSTVFGSYKLKDVYQREVDFMAPVWIIDPQYGSTRKSGALRIHGRTSQFSAGTYYSISESGSEQAARTMTISSKAIEDDGSFAITTRLKPGSYTLKVWGQEKSSDRRIGETSSTFNIK